MHDTTASVILKYLARKDLLRVTGTTFMVPRYPQVVHPLDVKEAFEALADKFNARKSELRVAFNFGAEAWTSDRLFERLFKVIFVEQKVYPRHDNEGPQPNNHEGRDLPLLFVGAEKTQVRQVPLAEAPPWPFKFLLELGGMVVVKTTDQRKLLEELKQFLNNHPQFEIRVDAKEAPDGSIVIYTWWFQQVPRKLKRSNVNVPPRVS